MYRQGSAKRGVILLLSIILVGGMAITSPVKAESASSAECAAEYAFLSREWGPTWPRSPTPKAGNNAFVESRHGQRYTATEYEAMRRRLMHGRKLCQDGAEEAALYEMKVVHAWMDRANGRDTPNQ